MNDHHFKNVAFIFFFGGIICIKCLLKIIFIVKHKNTHIQSSFIRLKQLFFSEKLASECKLKMKINECFKMIEYFLREMKILLFLSLFEYLVRMIMVPIPLGIEINRRHKCQHIYIFVSIAQNLVKRDLHKKNLIYTQKLVLVLGLRK